VAQVLDSGRSGNGEPFMVLEFLTGFDLGAARVGSELTIASAVTCALQVCRGMAVAHARGVVHRDIKPSNLFVTADVRGLPLIKILDFGISRYQGSRPGVITNSGNLIGSPCYVAPEQARDSKLADARSDIWSLGVVLYELLTGQLPFDGEQVGQVLSRVLTEEPVPPQKLRPEIPAGLERVVLQCLHKNPEERPQNMTLLADLLSPYAVGEIVVKARPVVSEAPRVSSIPPEPESATVSPAGVASHQAPTSQKSPRSGPQSSRRSGAPPPPKPRSAAASEPSRVPSDVAAASNRGKDTPRSGPQSRDVIDTAPGSRRSKQLRRSDSGFRPPPSSKPRSVATSDSDEIRKAWVWLAAAALVGVGIGVARMLYDDTSAHAPRRRTFATEPALGDVPVRKVPLGDVVSGVQAVSPQIAALRPAPAPALAIDGSGLAKVTAVAFVSSAAPAGILGGSDEKSKAPIAGAGVSAVQRTESLPGLQGVNGAPTSAPAVEAVVGVNGLATRLALREAPAGAGSASPAAANSPRSLPEVSVSPRLAAAARTPAGSAATSLLPRSAASAIGGGTPDSAGAQAVPSPVAAPSALLPVRTTPY
jgi:serine/threonine-protein kinase